MTIQSIKAKCLAEATGTFALVLFGCGAIRAHGLAESPVPASMIPTVFGLVIATMIYAFGHVSGAHFNPAVSLAFASIKKFPLSNALAYVSAQCIGAIAAAAALKVLIPQGTSMGATVPTISIGIAVLWELILSFFLMMVIMAVATDARAEGTMAGAAIGAIVWLAATVGGPFTGASMNPARSLGPAIFSVDALSTLPIYLLAPVVGCLLAALFYEWIRHDCRTQSESCEC